MVTVLGGPGTGRSTLCAAAAEAAGWTHLQAEELVEAAIESGSELGQQLAAVLASGQVLPQRLLLALLSQRILSGAGPCLLDGYPRSTAELAALEAEVGRLEAAEAVGALAALAAMAVRVVVEG